MQITRIKFDLQAEEERINREKQLEQEERMAKELARINYETQREEKMRQYIKENRYEHLLYILLAFVSSLSALASSFLLFTFKSF